MPRLKNATPKYRLHKGTGQAIVTIDGRDIYLGKHGSRPSKFEYKRLIGEWFQNGRRLPNESHSIAVAYYVKDGRSTGTAENMPPVMRLLRRYDGDTPVKDFGPLALKSLRQRMVEAGRARKYVNENVDRIRRMFKWAAGNELIPFEVYHRLPAVDGLRKGRTEARENAPSPY